MNRERKRIEDCYDRTHKLLWNLAYKITNDDEESYDIVQSAYLNLILRMPKLHDFDALELDAYVVGIAKKLCYRYFKMRKKQCSLDALEFLSSGEAVTEQEQFFETQCDLEILMKAWANLSPRYQTILYLKFWKNASAEQLAKRLQVKPESVRMMQTRAIRALKREYRRLEAKE